MSVFLVIILIGSAIRFFFVGNPGFVADISFWKSWSLAAIDYGVVWTTHNTNINYPPSFIYVLWIIGKIYSLLGNPHDYNTFWRENNFGFLLASKSIAIISDIIIASLIYWFFSQKEKLKQLGIVIENTKKRIMREATSKETISESELPQRTIDAKMIRSYAQNTGNKERQEHRRNSVSEGLLNNLPLLLSVVFFLNPVVILDSALWGQVESFGILFTLIAVILIFYKRPLLATAFFTIGFLMKLQNIIYIPLYFLFIYRYFDIKTSIKCLAVSCTTFLVLNLPFILINDMKQVLYLLTVNNDYFPWLSLNAHNLWWIVANAKGMEVIDKITVLGILNAKTVGLFIFSSFYLLSAILIFLRPTPRNFLLGLTVAIFAFFLFTTQSHERYSYPVLVLLLFLYPFLTDQTSSVKGEASSVKKDYFPFSSFPFPLKYYFWILYALLTVTIFFNLHTGLIANYPENGFFILTRITTPALTLLNSYLLILLFLLLLPFVFSQISWLFLIIPLLFFVFAVTASNASYLFSGKASLTRFKPIIMKQDYGSLGISKSANSFSGWKSWNRLSNNYFYYRKGFGTHANSNLVFDINRKFTKFITDIGVDTEADTPASVVFKIIGDGKILYESKKLGRFDFPEHLEINIAGVKFLGLEINDAGDGINNDHADWLNPILYK